LRFEAAAFRQAGFWLNGQPVPALQLDGRRWKKRRAVDLAAWACAGSNELVVWVTNDVGPPALWVWMTRPGGTGPEAFRWMVSEGGSEEKPARAAHVPMPIAPGSYLDGQVRLPDLVRSAWPGVGWLSLGAGILVGLGVAWGRFGRRGLSEQGAEVGAWLVLGASALGWALLLWNNLPQLPRIYGFDAEGHEQYIRVVQEEGRLPLADEGWQMYQPPLYYLLAAGLLELCGLTVAEEAAVVVLRAFNGLVGWLHVAAIFWVLRLLFPKERWKAVVGVGLVSALPAHVLISHYVTNEALAALWVTVAVGLALKAGRGPGGPGLAVGTGLVLGLALLTKFSALLALPVVLGLLGCRAGEERGGAGGWGVGSRAAWGQILLAVLVMLLVCGWHYGRVWWRLGSPLVGNWDLEAWTPWWQDPGYRTAWDYLRFGSVFVEPWFSGFRSFWDGLYATLWGDGLASSAAWMAFRPPWNEAWMAVSWWLSALWTGLLLLGAVVLSWRWVWAGDRAAWLGTGLLGLFLLGLLYMSVRVPSYAQVKAFYALPALSGLVVAAVTGWEKVAGRGAGRHAVLASLLVVWWGSCFRSLLVDANHPQTLVVQGIWALDRGDVSAAARCYGLAVGTAPQWPPLRAALAEAVRVWPREPTFRDLYAGCLEAQGFWEEALAQRREAVALAPARPEFLNNLAWLLATVPVEGLRRPEEAVQWARRACDLMQGGDPQFLGTLAAALAGSGQFEEAIRTAQEALKLAQQQGRTDLVERNQRYLELYRARQPLRLPLP